MKIVVFGLGYVGATAAACVLKDGHKVVGVDVSPDKAARITVDFSRVSEPRLDELLAAGRDDGRLSADTDVGGHLNDVDLAMFCVGAPSLLGGGQGLTQVGAVSEELGAALKTHDSARAYILENWTWEARFLKPQADMIATLKDSAKPVNTVSSRDGG